MPKKPDPGQGLSTAAARTARIAAWKRESNKTQRKNAKKDRVSDWEETTGLKHEVPPWA